MAVTADNSFSSVISMLKNIKKEISGEISFLQFIF